MFTTVIILLDIVDVVNMKFSLTKMLLLGIIVILSVTIGNISTIIKVRFDSTKHDKVKTDENSNRNDQLKLSNNKLKNNISNSYDDLIWFMQVCKLS